jgi:hypothetical protein
MMDSQFTSIRNLYIVTKNAAVGGFDIVLQRIRTLPGFGNFLLLPSEDRLKKEAVHGPIMIINSGLLTRCDAIIITTSEI